MKYLVIFVSLFVCSSIYAQQIDNTGICNDTVAISSKTVSIKNPIELKYLQPQERLVFIDNTFKNMKSAGYWISKLDNPDDVILSEKEIKEFNNKIFNTKVNITDLKVYPDTINTADFIKTLKTRFDYIAKKQYFNENFREIQKEYFEFLQNSIDIDTNSQKLQVKFAMTVKYSDVRILPAEDKIFSDPNNFDIDKLQEESLDLGVPLAVICQTKNKKWSYVVAPLEEGWIKTENLAYTDKKTITKWIDTKKIAVITSTKADIFLDEQMKNYFEYVRMGSKFPLLSKNKIYVSVKIPTADNQGNLVFKKAYIPRENINIGFLQYTQRNILTQAFKHLNSLYGWGGTNGEQDCSSFIGQIFNCFGIVMPETSFQKIKCGTLLTEFTSNQLPSQKEEFIINNATAGLSFIYLPGHITLYVGNEKNKPYAIHAIWGVSAYDQNNQKTIKYINKVIVSDLNIGNDVIGNSLLDRIIKINLLR
ncbi:MAG: SH3 domain-containing protein [Endomicrobiaceae bacterium]|nr:SH3 domain-containing protein [Endomicrobiaceae bacterium]